MTLQFPSYSGLNITTQRFHDIGSNSIFVLQTNLDMIVNKTKSKKYRISYLAHVIETEYAHIRGFNHMIQDMGTRFASRTGLKFPNGDMLVKESGATLPPPGPDRAVYYVKTSYYSVFLYLRKGADRKPIKDMFHIRLFEDWHRDWQDRYEILDDLIESEVAREVEYRGVIYGKILGISTP